MYVTGQEEDNLYHIDYESLTSPDQLEQKWISETGSAVEAVLTVCLGKYAISVTFYSSMDGGEQRGVAWKGINQGQRKGS